MDLLRDVDAFSVSNRKGYYLWFSMLFLQSLLFSTCANRII